MTQKSANPEEARLEALRRELHEHNHRYHVLDAPIVSDAEYDALYRELVEIESSHPDWITPDSPSQRVGGEPVGDLTPVTHRVPMLSLGNAHSDDEVRAFDARLRKLLGSDAPIRYMAEPKYDGMAIELRYENGAFVQGSTRGDGRVGEDVSHNLRNVRSLTRKLSGDVPAELDLRGEVYMPIEAFEKLNRERLEAGQEAYANPRNFTAGTLRQLDPRTSSARRLALFVYGAGHGIEALGVESQSALFARLSELGLRVSTPSRVCDDVETALAFHHELEARRDSLPYEVDGSVIKVDSLAIRAQVGELNRAPRWAIAYKFPPRQATSQVRNIQVFVSRTGALTPVAVVEPVHIGGVTVTNVSLHNQDEIERLDVRVNDIVLVERAGDVIPKVVKVILERRPTGKDEPQPYRIPDTCPVCGSEASRVDDEVVVRCPNLECPAQVRERLCHFVCRGGLDVEGLGGKLIDQLVERELVRRPSDFFTLERATLLELDRMGEKSADNLLAALEKASHTTLPRVLYGLGIRHVGERIAVLLAEHFGSLDALVAAPENTIEAVLEIGPTIAKSVRAFFDDPANHAEMERLKAKLDIAAPAPRVTAAKAGVAGRSFVLTGTMSVPREELAERIKAAGGKVASSVSKRTDYLVAGEKAGSKLTKAEELGIKVLDEAGLETLLAEP